MKRAALFTLLVLCYFLLIGKCSTACAFEPQIKVKLAQGRQQIELTAPGGLLASENEHQKAQPYEGRVIITQRSGELFINGHSAGKDVLYLRPQKETSAISFGQNRYAGIFIIRQLSGGLLVVNELPLEQYLRSVVPSEMPSAWPMDALKAQTVAARTFALYKMRHSEHKYYDVCNTTHCQVYDGLGVETKSSDNAVKETYGQVILYHHEPILAAFHADSGGRTENSEDVWDTKLPYLRSVADGTTDSPEHHWRISMTPFDFVRHLRDAGHNVGKIEAIELSPIDSAAPDRTQGGGVRYALVIGSGGKIKLPGYALRRIFGLKSTRFSIKALPETENTRSQGLNAQKISAATRTILFDGYGSGHRLGLSQWGAYDLSLKHENYLDILYDYYTDVSVSNNWYDGGL